MFNFNRYTLISSSFAFLTSIRYSKAVMGKCKYIREKLWLTICIISRGRSANRAPEGNSNIKGPGNSLFLEAKKEVLVLLGSSPSKCLQRAGRGVSHCQLMCCFRIGTS